MMNSICDMHVHSSCSDGELSPVQLVNFANKQGVKYISVTDHDTVDFYLNNEAKNLMDKYKMQYITGCEFICRVGLHPIEILGYGIDIEKSKKYLDKFGITEEKLRIIRIDNSTKILKKLGFEIKYHGLELDPVDVLFDFINSNEKLKNMLLNENPDLLNSPSNLLRQGLNNPKSMLFISPRKYYPSYKKLIRIIHKKLHGLAFVAHPYHYSNVMEEILNKVIKAKIDGIECYHYTVNSKEKNMYLINYAKKYNLLISGGSDFHNVNDIEQIRERNMIKIPEEIFEKIKLNLNKNK